MKKILFIIPYKITDDSELIELYEQYEDIEFRSIASFKNLSEELREMYYKGLEIVAARGVTAHTIRKLNLNISVVEMHMTIFDIYYELKNLPSEIKKIAVCTSGIKPTGFDMLPDIFKFEIKYYDSEDATVISNTVKHAIDEDAQYIFAGPIGYDVACKLNVPASIIYVGEESLKQTIKEIRQIQSAIEIEVTKNGFYKSVLENASEGIITIDTKHNITAINPIAQKIMRKKEKNVIGEPIKKVLPEIENDDAIVSISGTKVMFNKTPITVKGKSFGAIITFQEIDTIQKMEHIIRQNIYSRGHVAKYRFSDMVGTSQKFLDVVEQAKIFAETQSNILIFGESGTGKELFAQSIHNASNRATGPFVVINCAALPANILESELFGYVAGAFTGANKEGKTGLFEIAHKGTIFLDEISEMDYMNQSRLLRVLQEKTVVRLGSNVVTPVDIRIIAATNKDLRKMVEENKFRNDLYYRLNVLTLNVPSLSERKEDTKPLAEFFLNEFSKEHHKTISLSKESIELLREYNWPGNIRELRNAIERAVVITRGNRIEREAFDYIATLNNSKPDGLNDSMETEQTKRVLADKMLIKSNKKSLLSWELEIVKSTLKETNGDRAKTAEILGISRTTLWRKMKEIEKANLK